MTNCPPKLRGDLSKWLCEINTGVYVGQISGRVRDAVWERVCKNLSSGSATMVFTTNNEQRMDFRVHNTLWEPVDFDGIKLMRRPLPQNTAAPPLRHGFSKAAGYQMAERARKARKTRPGKPESYVVIDLETTGLYAQTDCIIEYGALRVKNGEPCETFSTLVRRDEPLPGQITAITGITDAMLRESGETPGEALDAFLRFIGGDRLVGYNIRFDLEFLRAECLRNNRQIPVNRSEDLLQLARRRVSGTDNYKLATLAEHFALPDKQTHRALQDCELAQKIFERIK